MATDNYSEILFNLKVTGIDTFAEALAELRNQISHTNKELAALDKEAKKSGGLNKEQTEEYKRLQTNLANYNAQLRTCKADIKNAEKATAALSAENKKAEGYYNELNESVKSLTKQYKNLSEEELKGAKGKDLIAKLQAQKKELKELDEEMGNYQRNVGNYKSATEGLGSTFTKVAGYVAVAVTAFKACEAVVNSTQMVGDKLNITIQQGKDALDLFTRSLLTDGLGVFEGNLKRVIATAREYAEIMDEMFERQNSLRLIEAENAEELINLELAMKNTALSAEERAEAGERYRELAAETYQIEKKMAEDANEAEAARFLASINVAESEKERLDKLLTDYARLSDAQKEGMLNVAKLIEKSGSIWGNIRNGAKDELEALRAQQPEIVKMGELWYQYNLSNDKATQRYVDTLVAAREAQSAYLRENKRIETTINSISAQLGKQTGLQTPISAEYAAALELANADEVIEEVNYQISTAIAKGADSSSVGVEIPVPITPIVDSTITLAELMTKHTFGELMGDNLWVQLLGLGDTYYTEEINERLNSYTDQLKEGLTQIGEEAWGAYLGAREEAIDRELEMEKKKNDARAESEKKALEGRFEQGKISQKKYEKELERIDAERATREEALEREAFSRKKRLNVADALMKGALAILDVWKSFAGDPISRGIQLAITAANTGIQVAAIQSQKFAKGGRIIGASHAAGGVKGWISGQNIELEGGEVVINKRSAALFSEQLSAINSYRGYGKKFARGGVLGSEKYMPAPVPAGVGSSGISAADLAQIITSTVDARISTLRVVVAESDITSAQNNAKRAEVAATF